MINSEHVKVQLNNLNESLTLYIRVHDDVFQQKLGAKLDYESMLSKLNEAMGIAKNVSSKLIGDLDESHVAVLYTNRLLETQKQLHHIVDKLRKKAQGEKYGFFEYIKDLKEYKKLEASYYDLGNDLNRFFSKL